ncbi:hypothetical protein OROGR_024133 [Orobanche gracilis]
MWQVLLAAAAATGSGVLAKKLIAKPTGAEKPISDYIQNGHECGRDNDPFKENGNQEESETFSNDGGKIFRFSSSESGSKELKNNTRNGFKGFQKNGGPKREKKNGAASGGRKKETAVDQRGNGSGKKISVCLKKRKTGKHVAGKCESCSSKDNSFGWGFGVGIMYMMSAGNAEISRLNCAMGETVKTVQELKAEVTRRKISVNENEIETNKKYLEISCNNPSFAEVDGKSKNNLILSSALIEEGEYASGRILQEDQQPEVLEMDRLEAEFESELQKLHWCATEGSSSEGRTKTFEAGAVVKESDGYNGVLPAELEGKLRNLLIEQQESQIVELEAELHDAHSKLNEKEAELQALKDCVKRLTQFSLTNASDEETENHEEVVKTIRDGIEQKVGFDSTESTVGMKRTLAYDSYICSKVEENKKSTDASNV